MTRCCATCTARDIFRFPGEEDEHFRPEPSPGIFGARRPGSKSRYRECFTNEDTNRGRPAGGHFAPTVKKMPEPDPIAEIKARWALASIDDLVGKLRISSRRLGSEQDYRNEIRAEAYAEYYADRQATAKQVVDRCERRIMKLYREVIVHAAHRSDDWKAESPKVKTLEKSCFQAFKTCFPKGQ